MYTKFDSLIICVDGDPYPYVKALYPFLDISGSICIFSTDIEPLSYCFYKLKEKEIAINLDYEETIVFPYQVKPQRSHPSREIYYSGSVVSGIKMENNINFGNGYLEKYTDHMMQVINEIDKKEN